MFQSLMLRGMALLLRQVVLGSADVHKAQALIAQIESAAALDKPDKS